VILSNLQKQPGDILQRGGIKDGQEGVSFATNYKAALESAGKIAAG
jgi:hypothetical protein